MSGRAAVYIRVSAVGSRDRDSASYGTEKDQEERCRAFAKAKGWKVVKVASDIDVSGGRWQRDGLDEVLALAEAGGIDAIVVYRLSRLGRNLRMVLETVERLDGHGVNLASVEEGLDRSTAAGRMLFNVLASFDQYERELRGEYWQAVKERARGRGVLVGPTPVGYRRIEGGEKAGVLDPDPLLAPVVEEIFTQRAAGISFPALAALMDERAPRPDGKHWSVTQVRRIIGSRTYLGEIHQAGSVTLKAHLPLVKEEAWYAAQDVRVRRPATSEKHDFLLSGVLRCAGCGQTMTGQAKGGGGHPIYRCRRRTAHGVCGAPATITASPVERLLTAAVLGRMRDREVSGVDQQPDVDVAALDRGAAAANDEVKVYLADVSLRSVLGDEEWRAGLDARLAAREETQAAAADARRQIASSSVEITAEDVAADRSLLRVAVAAEVESATVKRGRGLAVEDRVTVRFAD